MAATSNQLETDEAVDPMDEARMSVIEHLTELRRRVGWALGGVFVVFCLSYTVIDPVFEFLLTPLQAATHDASLAQMHHKDLAEPFFVLLKTAIFSGVFFGAPWILLQIWLFVAPALYSHEKKHAIGFTLMATLFFYLGASFCFFIVMPYGFEFLLSIGDEISEPQLMMNEYLAITTKLILAFGFVFEMPVIAMFLSAIGLLTHRHMLKFWRYSVVLAFVLAAVLTPPDVATQTMMAIPLVVLYFISIGVAWFFTTRREAREAAELAAMGEDAA